jgi:GNAT superfamily N-acetyltransferase
MTAIRSASVEDEAALFDLVRRFPTPTPPDFETYVEVLRAKLSDSMSYVLVAEADGVLVGYVASYMHQTFYASGPTSWVDELLVTPEARRRAVGRELIAAVERLAVDRRCVLIGLATAGARALDIRVLLPDGTKRRERREAPVAGRSNAQRWAKDRERFLVKNGKPRIAAPRKEVPSSRVRAPLSGGLRERESTEAEWRCAKTVNKRN